MRTFYSEYVQHCMRFYARHANPKFRSDADFPAPLSPKISTGMPILLILHFL